ncbi:hypothetical protein N8198_02150 [Gammaproteobacteria bacterium]|nr:hypothetical protein [Gammaproteobacteria bacterium]
MDLERIAEIEQTTGSKRNEVLRLGVSILFLATMLFFLIRGMMLPWYGNQYARH